MANAEKNLKRTKEAVQKAELLVKWKSKVVKVSKVGLEIAKMALDLAKEQRELARISQLVAEKLPSATKYSVAEYQKRLKKTQEKYQAAVDREKREALEAEQLKEQHERAAGGK